MSEPGFFERPILNSPYEYPGRHWELDADRQPTNHVLARRRRAEFLTPIPRPKRRSAERRELIVGAAELSGFESCLCGRIDVHRTGIVRIHVRIDVYRKWHFSMHDIRAVSR